MDDLPPPVAELSIDEKIKIVTGFLLDSPPGEVDDVYNDIRVLMNDDETFTAGILPGLEQYNIEQFVTARMPGGEYEEKEYDIIVSKYNQLENGQFIDPKSRQAFRFDHMRQVVAEILPYEIDETMEPQRAALETAVSEYVSDHYPNGVSAVYSKDEALIIVIVDNKYNPDNYWNGRWRSSWVITPESGQIKGIAKVNVHYFEDGNVQLNCNKDIELVAHANTEEHASAAAFYIKQISKAENEFQDSLNEAYSELSENTFKSLRRALPMTRHKLDWDKISNYKIGQELSTK